MLCVDFYLTIENREQIRLKMVEFARFCRIGIPSEDLETIAGEIIQNVLRHAYPEDHRGMVTLDYERIGDYDYLKVQDFGRGFDPSNITLYPLELSERGGMGLPLMAMMVDPGEMFLHSQKGEGTQIILRFPCKREGIGG